MIPMTAIAQAKKPAFRKLWRLVPTFQVAPPARGVSPAGSAASSIQLGITATTYVPRTKPA